MIPDTDTQGAKEEKESNISRCSGGSMHRWCHSWVPREEERRGEGRGREKEREGEKEGREKKKRNKNISVRSYVGQTV